MPFPVDIEHVKRAEVKLGIKLPLGYVVTMCKCNGGYVCVGNENDWHLFPIFDDGDRTRLKRTCNDVCRETRSAKEWPDFPPDAVAIAANGGGDLLVLLPGDE